MPPRRHQEWLRFLRRIDIETPKHFDVHVIGDTYATHIPAKARAWLTRGERFHMHVTPTLACWLNQVERFFGLITDDRIRCGVFTSVAELIAGDPAVPGAPQRRSRALRLDRFSRGNPGQGGPWATSDGGSTLALRGCLMHLRAPRDRGG